MGKAHCKRRTRAIPSAQNFLLKTLVNPEDRNDTGTLQKIILTHQMCILIRVITIKKCQTLPAEGRIKQDVATRNFTGSNSHVEKAAS